MNTPKIDLSKTGVRHVLTGAGSSITSVIVILGALWVVGKPHAANFITEVVEAKNYVRQADVVRIEKSTQTIKNEVRDLELRTRRIETKQTANSEKLDAITDLQKETRSLINQLLIQGRNRTAR